MPKASDLSGAAGRRACQNAGQMRLPLDHAAETLLAPRNLHGLVKSILAEDIRSCRFSREEIAVRLSILTGQSISLATLDSQAAESKEHRFPAEWIPAWVKVTGSRRLLDVLCSEAGLYLGDQTEHDLAELSRLRIQAKKASTRADELRRSLWDRI